jgi:GTP-binding protein HflX
MARLLVGPARHRRGDDSPHGGAWKPSRAYDSAWRNAQIRNDLFGNTQGLKPSEQKRLLSTYRRRVRPDELVSPELARHLCETSREVGRQVGALVSRKGEVEWVVVGDATRIELPDIGRARAGQVRLRGLRLVHTHLKDEPLTRDDLTDLALLRLDQVAAVVAGADGLPGAVHWAHLLPENGTGDLWHTFSAESVHEIPYDAAEQAAALESELARRAQARVVGAEGRAILVGVATGDRVRAEASLAELRELARTAGVEVLDAVLQVRKELDPRYLVGRGKLEELNLRAMQRMADLLIFDRDLSASQAHHIAELTSLKILDRTQLILDIFAQRARSADGKLQVELAQLRYLLGRLRGKDDSLSRLTGGIGGRGPGETKLEVHRERVRARIARLERHIDALSEDRQTRRQRRGRAGLPVVSIVGYTNAGKSTLLNALTESHVLVEDKLFATLDPTSRRLRFPRDREVIITDTVGFIRDLPRDLVNAFRATLEELLDADLLLHVVDASDALHEDHVRAVESVLEELGLAKAQRLLVYNKSDALPPGQAGTLAARAGGVAICALRREGFDALLARCEKLLWAEGKVAAPEGEPRFAPPPP